MPPSLPEATPPLLRVMVVEDERVVARDQKRGKPLASDMGKDSAAVERSGAAN